MMNTPIRDFVKSYAAANPVRMHMPGHKGKDIIGVEKFDVTEFDGADDLYHTDGVIKESENNASKLFGAHTYYSTEGASLSIRAMLYLAYKYAVRRGFSPLVLAARNAHKSFISAAALIGFDVEWLLPDDSTNYISCNITAKYLGEVLSAAKVKPFAVYVTTPDYLGNLTDVKALSTVCKKYGVMLLVDNAHGAYLKFLSPSLHPIDCGADMCCDSAHKTLPTLTGGAYLHVSKTAAEELSSGAKEALSLFGSTSPSYLILQSLDLTNAFIADGYCKKLKKTIDRISLLKDKLIRLGYTPIGNEPLKITIQTKNYGYTGKELSEILKKENILLEFYDDDFITLMFSAHTEESDFDRLENVFERTKKLPVIPTVPPKQILPEKVLRIRDAILSPSENVDLEKACGRILSAISVCCPPAVPIVVIGEKIDKNTVELLKYYGVKTCTVIKN